VILCVGEWWCGKGGAERVVRVIVQSRVWFKDFRRAVAVERYPVKNPMDSFSARSTAVSPMVKIGFGQNVT